MIEDTQLITIPAEQSALAIFTTEGAIEPLLARIKEKIDAFVPDMTTTKGRKEIASFAYKVTQSKTYLESVGKKLADEQKEIPKKIDAARRMVKTKLDEWATEVRKPLSDWEEAEASRVLKHEDAIRAILGSATPGPTVASDVLRHELRTIEAVSGGAECEEYEAAYADAKAKAIAGLTAALAVRSQYEADQAELSALRAAQVERDAKEVEAAAVAAAEKAEEDRRNAEIQRAANEVRIEVERKKDAEEKAVLQARLDSEAEQRRALQAELDAKQEAEAAAEREAAETKRRENDRAHRAKINKRIVEDIMLILGSGAGRDPELAAKAIVTAIAKSEIDNLSIHY